LKQVKSNIGIVLLAAGSSSRMGRSKQLLIVNDKSLLSIATGAAASSKASRTVVVLAANEEAHHITVSKFPVDIIVNVFSQKGMGSSLKEGLNFLLKKDPAIGAVIILVCDQPMISSAHIDKIIDKYLQSGNPIIASKYDNTTGVPVLFDKSYFEKLLSLQDDQGAKKIVQENPADMDVVDFPGGEIDLDTIEEYNRFIKSQ
jgi:molybdenum cofactor cytidylyltransferase